MKPGLLFKGLHIIIFAVFMFDFELSIAAEEKLIAKNTVQELLRTGDFEKAIEKLKDAYGLFPYDENIKYSLAKAYTALGDKQMHGKQFVDASESYNNALKLYPDSYELMVMRGGALYYAKRYDEAAIILEQSRLGGEKALTFFLLGRIHYDSGDLPGGIDMWEKAISLDPDNKNTLRLLEKARREAKVESVMEKNERAMFQISFDEGAISDLADEVLKTLESAYNRIGSDFSCYPVARVPVILYTRKEYRLISAGPEWSGGLYDGKIRLPIGGAKNLNKMMNGVLFHEYTHVVVGEITKGNCPTWLNEGLAEFEGRKEYDPPMTALETAAKAARFLPFSRLEKTFLSMDGKDVLLAYQQSYSMVSFIISEYGLHKIREILTNLGNGLNLDSAISKALEDYQITYEGIEKKWQEQTIKTYRE